MIANRLQDAQILDFLCNGTGFLSTFHLGDPFATKLTI
jgi:hypothetical protein